MRELFPVVEGFLFEGMLVCGLVYEMTGSFWSWLDSKLCGLSLEILDRSWVDILVCSM